MDKRHSSLILLAAVLLAAVLTASAAFAGGTSQPQPGAAATPAALTVSNRATEHVVKWGETLAKIAQLYDMSVRTLADYNGIANPDRIYAGQRLRIPRGGQPTVAPSRPTVAPSRPTATPPPAASTEEEIVIQAPGRGVTITSPVIVSGLAISPFEQTVTVVVLDAAGGRIGQAATTITGEYGQRGPFKATVPFTLPANSQPGRIQVYTTSPRDGALEHLSSVPVMLQGAELDALLEQLEAAVYAKDYAGLQSLMGPKFSLNHYRSGTTELTPAEATDQLHRDLMGPGMPRLDFSLDARALLGSRVTIGPEISHVVYSRGWGANRDDDAFLMIGDVDGQARWVGLLYVPHALIDYRLVGRAAAT